MNDLCREILGITLVGFKRVIVIIGVVGFCLLWMGGLLLALKWGLMGVGCERIDCANNMTLWLKLWATVSVLLSVTFISFLLGITDYEKPVEKPKVAGPSWPWN